ncbi:putative lipid II flippase FtsW [endosymbiont of Sipalinus gigas]|uniref:putative lipid II flippase FtsW n=1 Tax=endosymbiont of Sipalinus gigas TaxID=1972134 RepID=UPI000DC6D4E5|nr:putative lipid II flippase FtsW [endosymbiont of Sipalinus gigas]BBA85177.1 putative lipid II flippase FtsW [endosymbiont of Sipalinus gigas]
MFYIKNNNNLYDKKLFNIFLFLISFGFIMIISSSMPYGYKLSKDILFFVKKTILIILLIFILSPIILNLPIKIWNYYSFHILLLNLVLLLISLILGKKINGSRRWIKLGILTIQPSELIKFTLINYFSSCLSNYIKGEDNKLCKIEYFFLFFFIILLLLLFQPDIGTFLILLLTILSVLIILNINIKRIFYILLVFSFFIKKILNKKYILIRLIAFLNPWKDPFNSGYQLIQSFISYGRGGIFGRGLGNSIQKMNYLPESYNDFIFSIISEEFGYLFSLTIILLIFFISIKAIRIGNESIRLNNIFESIISYSIGIWINIQTNMNIGTAIGIIPTKGITLPLISYGGSSLLITSISIFILIRIDFENKLKSKFQVINKNEKKNNYNY